ncbi:IS481 family transposase [Jeongeupia sp. USM3]|uniref:IS481 family transposase n=1 Tax=Jeongeupia sp. USM3 TaxID=1906741 RepID=UPI00089DE5CF|nr:IS481 family transposase [Jeongeupia sp. USM3]AOY02061.1 IS481 family transposase [Jeongeupia sp. USM3]
MSHRLHSNARTTPLTREEIRHSSLSQRELMLRYSVGKDTIRKWQTRDEFTDRSHRPHTLHTTLSQTQEALVLILRTTLLLPLDDLAAVAQRFINPNATRSGINRLLVREGVGNLKTLQAQLQPEEPAAPSKGFKDYAPGYFHLDIKYLPQMPDETSRSYLFVAIDRATRWVFLHIYPDQSEASSVDFLQRLYKAAPMKIEKLLTDNGSQFTDRFTSKAKTPSGRHVFDRRCAALGIEHRLIPPRTPQMNGMVERFNGRISELVKQTRFASAAELAQTLDDYRNAYNHHIPQKALGFRSPIESLKMWQTERPELFKKKIYKQAEPDNYGREEHQWCCDRSGR